MKITDPHHSTRKFLIEKGAARPVTRTGVAREGGSVHQTGQQLVGRVPASRCPALCRGGWPSRYAVD